MIRKTWKRCIDGHEEIGLNKGVSIAEAICTLSAYEDTGIEPDSCANMKGAEST